MGKMMMRDPVRTYFQKRLFKQLCSSLIPQGTTDDNNKYNTPQQLCSSSSRSLDEHPSEKNGASVPTQPSFLSSFPAPRQAPTMPT